MKKRLLFVLLAAGVCFSACQKESTVSTVTPLLTKKTGTQLQVPAATYYNTDYNAGPPVSYTGSFHGCNFSIGGIYYNSSLYPNLVNGVPLYGTIQPTDPGCSIDIVSTSSGTIFSSWVTTAPAGSLDAGKKQYRTDLEKYFAAETKYQKGGGAVNAPSIFDYVKQDYGSTGTSTGPTQPTVYTGKLIRITSGSNVAIGEITYPIPASTTSSAIGQGYILVLDPLDHTILYQVWGNNGKLTYSLIGSTPDQGASYQMTGTQLMSNGTYNFPQPGTSIIHGIGTIVRQDDSSFSFDITQDNS